MSFENKSSHDQFLAMDEMDENLYALLGNDVDDDKADESFPREIVKKTTSSKKADVAPASADPAKAKKTKKPASGNEAALKSKVNNKAVAAPAGGAKPVKKAFDRHSRTGKTDSKKKIGQAWGDDRRELSDEIAGEADAAADAAAEAATAAAAPAGKTLQEYLAEKQQNAIGGAKQARKANEGAEDKWSSTEIIQKETQSFVQSTAGKKYKQKAAKGKTLLTFDAVFDEEPRFGKKTGFNGKKGGFNGKKTAKPAAINDQNFPSL